MSALTGVFTLTLFTLSSCRIHSIRNPFQQKIPEATEVIPEAQPPIASTQPIPLPPSTQQPVVHPTLEETQVIGEKIFLNETNGDKNKLVHWNVNEDFAAMGIGHFTWYPSGRKQTYGSTFPDLVNYLDARGATPPAWLKLAINRGAPWYSRQELNRVKHTPQIQHLINYLYETRALQTAFIVERAKSALQKVVNLAPYQDKLRVANNINVLANTPGGWYPLIDYINFKGEGFSLNPNYNNTNWGLMQVLQQMQPSVVGQQALDAFADAAFIVLTRRVENAPAGSADKTKLAGWRRRVNTYRVF